MLKYRKNIHKENLRDFFNLIKYNCRYLKNLRSGVQPKKLKNHEVVISATWSTMSDGLQHFYA